MQNRTLEFQQCVSTYDRINKKAVRPAPPPSISNKKSKFSVEALRIASDISRVSGLLAKLALLAKRKSLLDDKPVEIAELTYVIKQDIFKIGQNMQNLQRVAKGETTHADPQTSHFSKNVVNLLNSKMKNVSGEFKSVLETRQQNELARKTRHEKFVSPTLGLSPLQNLGENPFAGLLMSQAYPPSSEKSSSPYDNDEMLSIPSQTQQLLMMEEEQQGLYLHQRNLAVETIELTINEVGNLFLQLATMVTEQGEQIQRIDENVEDISINISGAQRELLKYYAHITNNRWLFLKIFGVLIVFFFLWVMVS